MEVTLRLTPRNLDAMLASRGVLLKLIGALVVSQAQKAFQDQRLGDVVWPERYPAMKEPFINLAPVIQKAGEGREPSGDDFNRRPALGGAGSALARSILFVVEGDSAVTIGSNRPDLNPGLFQFGGIGRIPITDTTKATLAAWLTRGFDSSRSTLPGWLNMGKGLSRRKVAGTGNERGAYAKKLAFVFRDGKTEHVQGAYPRPFVGFTDETFANLADLFPQWAAAVAA